VNRINLAVLPSLEEIRPQFAGVEGQVVAPLVVVLDLQIVIAQKALGNDQIVRFIAADSSFMRGAKPKPGTAQG
jgi:hypothetical protein